MSIHYDGQIPDDLRLDPSGLPLAALVEVHQTIDSTNTRVYSLLESCTAPAGTCLHTLIIADQQTAGRGRLQKQWWSPAGQNIYMSFGFSVPATVPLYGLSLAVGLAVRQVIQVTTGLSEVYVKWPNDLLTPKGKLAGILIEASQRENHWWIIIGLGLNVNTQEVSASQVLEQPWTSLKLLTGQVFCRGSLLQAMTIAIENCMAEFAEKGWSTFANDWRAADWLYEQHVVVSNAGDKNRTLTGIAQGVDELGQLLVRDEAGQLHHLISGELSVRREEVKN